MEDPIPSPAFALRPVHTQELQRSGLLSRTQNVRGVPTGPMSIPALPTDVQDVRYLRCATRTWYEGPARRSGDQAWSGPGPPDDNKRQRTSPTANPLSPKGKGQSEECDGSQGNGRRLPWTTLSAHRPVVYRIVTEWSPVESRVHGVPTVTGDGCHAGRSSTSHATRRIAATRASPSRSAGNGTARTERTIRTVSGSPTGMTWKATSPCRVIGAPSTPKAGKGPKPGPHPPGQP